MFRVFKEKTYTNAPFENVFKTCFKIQILKLKTLCNM